jgi:hypothetical protein
LLLLVVLTRVLAPLAPLLLLLVVLTCRHLSCCCSLF